MSTKKEEILKLVMEGKTLDDILELGFNRKYVKEVIRKFNKKEDKSLDSNKTKDDDIVQMQKDIKEIKKLLNEQGSLDKKELLGDNKIIFKKQQLDQALKILNFVKDNEQFLNYIQLDINISITDVEKNQKTETLKSKDINGVKINPIEIYRKSGEVVLRGILNSFDVEQLKDIARQYMPDARGYVYKWNDNNKIIDYVVDRSISLSEKGSVFVTD
ncbi:hypothetical protein [Clostridium algidicarnis]|uniref:Uncharacterized protein n=2 Tax=Clostridium algidicarnis TaxID=37659 RepID=A0A2S6FV16_9CLOT|nr:hypothetical protein [Clostridium algidicarnis]MBU3197648.1 hypothetical protein [Clostridium algidicarnis]MBU3221089.1 hypothetical protein [Clostridium algidicarnis]PPK45559.1 hypothetical protein BD821_11912 [Clostridium algidicarnis DSM 15099]